MFHSRSGLYLQHLRLVVVEYPADVLLILLGIKSTGAVYEQSAVVQTLPGIRNDVTLQSPAFLHVLRTPLADGRLVFAEHPLTRARHVTEYHVKSHLRLAVVLRIRIGDIAVRVAPFLDVLQEDARTVADGLVAV